MNSSRGGLRVWAEDFGCFDVKSMIFGLGGQDLVVGVRLAGRGFASKEVKVSYDINLRGRVDGRYLYWMWPWTNCHA